MCRYATVWLLAAATVSFAQSVPVEWRRVGNTALELQLPGPAGGPVARVWYAADGTHLYARTASGRVFETADFEKWQPASDSTQPPEPAALATRKPESTATVRAASASGGRLYAAGTFAWRSEDGGARWTNLTRWKGASILGGKLNDVAVSPKDGSEIVVAGETGLWRSLDAGLTWSGLNADLPNLPLDRIIAVPTGTQALRIAGPFGEAEWRTGVKTGWLPAPADVSATEAARKAQLTEVLGSSITAVAVSGEALYAGSEDGRIWASTNGGTTWSRHVTAAPGAKITAFYVDPRDTMYALAAVTANGRGRVLRTVNGGVLWDEVVESPALPALNGITADHRAGAIYVASAKGVWMSIGGAPWTPISAGLPDVPARDVRLNHAGHQLYAALDGYGVYAAVAPHRRQAPLLVSAGDLTERAAAPGALLTVVGRPIDTARAGERSIPVLAQSQVQLPFDMSGSRVSIDLISAAGTTTHTLALDSAAPAIFVDADGGALITNAETGLLLDAGTPVAPGTRLQIFSSGLGRVSPDWPAGVAAPINNPPEVIAPVRVFVDRQPAEVTRAILAPGYIGFYLVEVELPAIMNSGTVELYLDVDGRQSNRVKLYIEP